MQWEESETGGGGEDQMETYRVKEERPVCARRGSHLRHEPMGRDSNVEYAHERNNPTPN